MYWYLQDRIGNGFEMRSLEHCLNDIIKGANDVGPHDFNKGKFYLGLFFLTKKINKYFYINIRQTVFFTYRRSYS